MKINTAFQVPMLSQRQLNKIRHLISITLCDILSLKTLGIKFVWKLFEHPTISIFLIWTQLCLIKALW